MDVVARHSVHKRVRILRAFHHLTLHVRTMRAYTHDTRIVSLKLYVYAT